MSAWTPNTHYLQGDVVELDGVRWSLAVREGISGATGPRLADFMAREPSVDGTCSWRSFHGHSPVGDFTWSPAVPHAREWQPSNEYLAGELVSNDGCVWRCSVAGRSRAVRPWRASQAHAVGDLVEADGQIWTCTIAGTTAPSDTSNWTPWTPYVVGQHVVTSAAPPWTPAPRLYRCTVAGTSSASIPVHTSGTAADGSVTWRFVTENYAGMPRSASSDPQVDGTCSWSRLGDGPAGPRRVDADTVTDGGVTWERVYP